MVPEPYRQLHPQSTGILANSTNTLIQGGQFIQQNVFQTSKDPFEHLQERVAPTAFHNSAQRVDPPRCHENTRKAVLNEILEWILQDTVRTAWILWLNGAAGAGKTAIGQSVAELCVARGILVASFFFFRSDPTRNSITPLVATLAYQLIQLIPAMKEPILSIVNADPLIFQQSFDTQFDKLIIQPLRKLPDGWKLLLIIDGVDECNGRDNQTHIIRIVAQMLSSRDLPLIVMFGSRTENQLKMAFNAPKVSSILRRMPLDNNYLPEDDIRLFLCDEFTEIKQTHPFSDLLDTKWPEPPLLEGIVTKSSGQFVYAAVVMKFVSSPHLHPAQQLEIVRGLRPTGSATPFAQLDALYCHIFSRVPEIENVKALLALIILGDTTDIQWIAYFFDVPATDIQIAFAELTSVLTCKAKVQFLHASLPDFLLDGARSQEYHIDLAVWGTRLSLRWLNTWEECILKDAAYNRIVLSVLKHATYSFDLRESILAFTPVVYLTTAFLVDLLTAIQRLDLRDDGTTYRKQLNSITRFIKNERKRDIPFVEKEHDVTHILNDIALEEEQSRQALSDHAQAKKAEKREANEEEARQAANRKEDQMMEAEVRDAEQKKTLQSDESDREIRSTENSLIPPKRTATKSSWRARLKSRFSF